MVGVSASNLRIEPLGEQHDREAFSCGVEALDRYFKGFAAQDVRRRVAATFVLVIGDGEVAGYYTLSSTGIPFQDLPQSITRKLPKYKYMPAILLGRLAVSLKYRGRKFGDYLLVDALKRSLRQSREVGAMAVVVDAKDDLARSFYSHYQFIPLPQIPRRLFLPMETLERSFT
ncbi:MAG: GNAT family N-acetyltransferase [Elusimicrobia bacterium]|nr:GNAT family N-acetyltransferase [Elusimicrobiota bacterium]